MILYAQASLAHWLEAGTALHEQRGEWLLSRVYSVVDLPEMAFHHAERCIKLTHEHADLMKDFDLAFANECMARALAFKGEKTRALEYCHLAEEAGRKIKTEEDRKVFFDDYNGGNWNGIK